MHFLCKCNPKLCENFLSITLAICFTYYSYIHTPWMLWILQKSEKANMCCKCVSVCVFTTLFTDMFERILQIQCYNLASMNIVTPWIHNSTSTKKCVHEMLVCFIYSCVVILVL